MGVLQTPKQFLPGVDRALARTTPALPAKSHAAPPLFACKRAHNAPACYQLFAVKGKGAAFSQRLAVSIQNPGGRSPEGFSRPVRPRTKIPERPSAEGFSLSPRVILAPARLTRPRTAWEFAKLPFCSAKPRFLQLGERGATRPSKSNVSETWLVAPHSKSQNHLL